ncbi:MAG: RHS repeat-associated core domain-containing protein [Paludibacteraceae bacterium]
MSVDAYVRNYNSAVGRFTSVDPLAEQYYSISPYAYCKNNSVNRIDPNGLDDYRYDDKTGDFHLMKQTDDKTDRVLGYHLNKETGEYEQNTKWYQTKTRMEMVEKGILSDGVNFMINNNVIAVGGEGQASVDGVEAFVVNLSDMVGKEIGGAYFSKDGIGSTTHISIGRYKNNGYKITKGGYGHTLWNKLYPNSKLENSLTGFFHTHPSGANISVSDRTKPSQQDKTSRDEALKIMPNLQFYILTHPINYGDKFPLKIPYTTWP